MIAFNRKQIKKYKYTLYTVSILNSQYNFVFFLHWLRVSWVVVFVLRYIKYVSSFLALTSVCSHVKLSSGKANPLT